MRRRNPHLARRLPPRGGLVTRAQATAIGAVVALAIGFVALTVDHSRAAQHAPAWTFIAAIISAAILWAWHGALDYCNRPGRHRRPPEPEGVRIVHPDGTETPCELAYIGVQHGWHEWAITTLMGVGDELRVDKVHACTVISADVTDDVSGARWDGRQYRMEGKA
jgi:hypothetical protein